jgi:hypothetical protein
VLISNLCKENAQRSKCTAVLKHNTSPRQAIQLVLVECLCLLDKADDDRREHWMCPRLQECRYKRLGDEMKDPHQLKLFLKVVHRVSHFDVFKYGNSIKVCLALVYHDFVDLNRRNGIAIALLQWNFTLAGITTARRVASSSLAMVFKCFLGNVNITAIFNFI